MSESIYEPQSLLAAFPYSLSRDTDKDKLAVAVADELVRTLTNTDRAMIFPRIDELPEQVLDILAYDLKIDWYELDAPVWNKRQAVKECLLVHKYKGTKYAVETALRSMYNSAEVKEWFEYGGEPFHFTVKVYGSTSSGLKTLYLKIQYAKNLRSVMDKVSFELVLEQAVEIYFGSKTAAIQKQLGTELNARDEEIYTTGGGYYAGIQKTKVFKKQSAYLESNDDSVYSMFTSGLIGANVASFSKKIRADLSYTGEYSANAEGNYRAALKAARFAKNIEVEVKL